MFSIKNIKSISIDLIRISFLVRYIFFKKKEDVTMFRFLGVLPGVLFDELQLEKVGELLRVVRSKFYQREEISKVKTFI